jgi:hypothetical protein
MADDEEVEIAYVLTVDVPGLRKGEKLAIDGIGEVTNGQTVEITRDEADAFRTAHQTQKVETDKDGNMIVETVQGPTLLQAFRKDEAFTVEVADNQPDEPDEPDPEPDPEPEDEPDDNEGGEQ